MTRFWGKLFLINFAVGVVTGITLEFQFGTNWSGYSAYVGDIFGSLLAIEATAAFFLESTLIGVWVFGWKKLSRQAHAAVMWLVAGASNLSAIWVLTANGWMQQPIGFALRNGRAELTDFAAVVFNTFSILQILHVVPAALLLAAFFAKVIGLKEFPRDQRPPVLPTFLSFRVMVALGTYFAVMMLIGIFIRKRLLENPRYLKLMMVSIPLPFLAHTAGWVLAEVGRQPWIVYGLMKTAEAVSPVAASQVAVSLVAFILVYGLLGGVGYYLIAKYARLGPDAVAGPIADVGKSLKPAAV